MLELILEGEAPYDIFVRWKPLEEQPIGWEPDLNDGVRLNIRPFVDGGCPSQDPEDQVGQGPWQRPGDRALVPRFQGDRINDHHLTARGEAATRATPPRDEQQRRDRSSQCPRARGDCASASLLVRPQRPRAASCPPLAGQTIGVASSRGSSDGDFADRQPRRLRRRPERTCDLDSVRCRPDAWSRS